MQTLIALQTEKDVTEVRNKKKRNFPNYSDQSLDNLTVLHDISLKWLYARA